MGQVMGRYGAGYGAGVPVHLRVGPAAPWGALWGALWGRWQLKSSSQNSWNQRLRRLFSRERDVKYSSKPAQAPQRHLATHSDPQRHTATHRDP